MISKGDIPIGGLIGRTSHKMRLLIDKVFHKNNIDLNFEQFMLLKCLSFNDGINQQELSEITDRNKATVARLVSKIEKKNLILRINSKEDKRVNNIYLTNMGKEMLVDIKPHVDTINDALVNSIAEDEFDKLKLILNKLTLKITEIDKKL